MGRRRRNANEPAWDGLLIIDKPAGWTSHDVVGRLRSLLGIRRIGHAGTLDPDATGVLVCGVGKGTRLLTYLTGADKEYQAAVRLGASTVTDDAAGELLAAPGCPPMGEQDVAALDAALAGLTGPILQVPSAVSAVKVDGRRAYDVVRSGQAPDLAARPVTVYRMTRTSDPQAVLLGPSGVAGVEFGLAVTCSSGTYVRALARDVGEAFGGGHLGALRRTRVGPFTLADALSLETLSQALTHAGAGAGAGADAGAAADAASAGSDAAGATAPDAEDEPSLASTLSGLTAGALSLGASARRFLPWVAVGAAAEADLRHGRAVTLGAERELHTPDSPVQEANDRYPDVEALVALVSSADPDRLLAVARRANDQYAPVAVFAGAGAGSPG